MDLFDPATEVCEFLASRKARLAQARWSRPRDRQEACRLAYGLFVFERAEEALRLSRHLAQELKDGEEAEYALALVAHLNQERLSQLKVGMPRKNGSLLEKKLLRKGGPPSEEWEARLSELMEQVFVAAVGPGPRLNPQDLLLWTEDNLNRLRELVPRRTGQGARPVGRKPPPNDSPPIELPRAFAPQATDPAALRAARAAAGRQFKWSRSRSLLDASTLALWLEIAGHPDEASEVCSFLAESRFTGDHSLWAGVETALALQALLRPPGQISRILDAGFVIDRLEGGLLEAPLESARERAQGQNAREIGWLLSALAELTVIRAVLKARGQSRPKLERLWQEVRSRLKEHL
ncbi:MAG: hypothetical protein AMXMBFR33_63880 [Candidatus Xenobia bacterium]